MKISYNWLKEYVDIKLPPEKLAGTLSMAGLSVDSIKKIPGDSVLEIEITSNRPDWLSYIGVAREVAALTGKKVKIPAKTKLGVRGSGTGVRVKVEDKKLCPKYTARVIRNVKVGESPAWLKTKIEAMGLRSVNNIVDITNFCLFETGEPMHAFDLDRISGAEIVVRRAAKSEKITTIEGSVKELDDSILVIADNYAPIAIAGVMGGLNTEVTYSTKNILLEAAYFDQVSVRRTARKLALSTESSYRFERRVDPENILYSSNRTAALICELAKGEPGEIFNIGSMKAKKKAIALSTAKMNKILGLNIAKEKAKKILVSLGLKAKAGSGESIILEPPSSRNDLKCEIDLIEEVARIDGYENIPETIPAVVAQPERQPLNMIVERRARRILASLGAFEAITYSLLSKKALTMSDSCGEDIVEVKNPLSSEQEAMRPNLITGLLGSIMWNINRKSRDLKLFELGNVYGRLSNSAFKETKHLSIGMTGDISSGWTSQARAVTFFDLKGAVEELFSDLGIERVSFVEAGDKLFSRAASATIEISGERIGVIGQISPRIAKNFDIKDKVFAAEIDMGGLLKYVNLEKKFEELPRVPSVYRDISVIADKAVSNSSIISLVVEAGRPILKEVKLIDRYAGKPIPDGKASLTYRLEYQNPAKTLEEKEVQDVHSGILKALEEKLGAKLR